MNDQSARLNGHASSAWIEAAERDFGQRLERYARALTGRTELAREVVQDTFLQLCQQPGPEPGFPVGPWLFRVCRNRAIDVQRREKRMTTGTAALLDNQSDRDGDPSEIVARQEHDSQVATLLSGLTAIQQDVVRLKFQGNFTYREIAEVTGMSVSHVGVALHEALNKVRQRLGKSNP